MYFIFLTIHAYSKIIPSYKHLRFYHMNVLLSLIMILKRVKTTVFSFTGLNQIPNTMFNLMSYSRLKLIFIESSHFFKHSQIDKWNLPECLRFIFIQSVSRLRLFSFFTIRTYALDQN